jgi:hypothetical protein
MVVHLSYRTALGPVGPVGPFGVDSTSRSKTTKRRSQGSARCGTVQISALVGYFQRRSRSTTSGRAARACTFI